MSSSSKAGVVTVVVVLDVVDEGSGTVVGVLVSVVASVVVGDSGALAGEASAQPATTTANTATTNHAPDRRDRVRGEGNSSMRILRLPRTAA